MKPFEGFTAETIDFLWELRMNNSREWMEENRDRYKRVLKEPFDSLAAALAAESTAFGGREMKCSVSRINRDIRFSKDKSLYRDVVWCTFSRRGDDLPCFFFEFSPRCVRWGMGYYCTPRPVMEQLRLMAAGDHPLYTAAMNSLRSSSRLVLTGEKYKRPHFPLQPAL